jgi:hypothetical protein
MPPTDTGAAMSDAITAHVTATVQAAVAIATKQMALPATVPAPAKAAVPASEPETTITTGATPVMPLEPVSGGTTVVVGAERICTAFAGSMLSVTVATALGSVATVTVDASTIPNATVEKLASKALRFAEAFGSSTSMLEAVLTPLKDLLGTFLSKL